jgi:hypothetical protein
MPFPYTCTATDAARQTYTRSATCPPDVLCHRGRSDFSINKIAAIPDRIFLVLDAYYVMESSQVDEARAFLTEHLPPELHLVIATRDDLHLSLARLRARGQLTEPRATDLYPRVYVVFPGRCARNHSAPAGNPSPGADEGHKP